MSSTQTQTRTPAESLEPYGQLIRMLMPRAASIDIFDSAGARYWSSNTFDSFDLQPLVARAWQQAKDAEETLSKQLEDGTPVYLFPLWNETGEPLALLAVTESHEGRKVRPWSLVNSLLRPALECLQRELISQESIGILNQTLAEHDKDLDLLLAMTGDKNAAGGPSEAGSVASQATQEDEDRSDDHGTDELRWLVQRSVDHLGALFGALVIPEKGIAICRAAQGIAPAQGVEALTRTHRHLMTWTQQQAKTLVVNKVAASTMPGALPYKILCCPVRQASSRVVGFFALFRTEDREDFDHRHTRITRLLARKVAAVLQANYDNVTGLLTRAAFERLVPAVLKDFRSDEHCLAYIDIDQMHVINENFGMHIGDVVIARVAEMARRVPHPRAVSARISGDRLALLLPECDLEKGADIAKKLCDAVRRSPEEHAGQEAPELSISIGVAGLSGARKLAHTLAAAEAACKAAKDRGRDRVEVYQDADASIIRRHTDINVAARLRDALRNDQFRLELQPILPLQGFAGAPCKGEAKEPHFELLLRMLGPDGHSVQPDKFLSAAARYQLMPSIDRWVIEHTMQSLKEHAALIRRHPACFTINLSAPSIAQPHFAGFVEAAVRASGLPAATFCFELTETAAVANMGRAEDFMQRLRALGARFALDDFGTGFSSLAYLKALPVSVLKIDGSFVRDILLDGRSQSMVCAIAQLAKTLGMETVAEYVETDEIRKRVTLLGVDYGQGFCLGRPQPLADVLKDLPVFEAFAQSQQRDSTAGAPLGVPPGAQTELSKTAALAFNAH